MSWEALIRFAPLLSAERFVNPEWERPGRDSYWGGSLKLLRREGVPLLVDHEDARRIGTVHALYELDAAGDKWVVADATVTDPPAWLRKGTAASFGRYNGHAKRLAEGHERVTSAFVSEVSVLAPGVEPAEPLAKVLRFAPAEQPKPRPAVTRERAEVIVHPTARSDPEREELQRRIEWTERRTGRPAIVEAIIVGMQRELRGTGLHDLIVH